MNEKLISNNNQKDLGITVLPSIDIHPVVRSLNISHPISLDIPPAETNVPMQSPVYSTNEQSTPLPVPTEKKPISLEEFKNLLKNETEVRAQQRSYERAQHLENLERILGLPS